MGSRFCGCRLPGTNSSARTNGATPSITTRYADPRTLTPCSISSPLSALPDRDIHRDRLFHVDCRRKRMPSQSTSAIVRWTRPHEGARVVLGAVPGLGVPTPGFLMDFHRCDLVRLRLRAPD